jgi:hypothetical protein
MSDPNKDIDLLLAGGLLSVEPIQPASPHKSSKKEKKSHHHHHHHHSSSQNDSASNSETSDAVAAVDEVTTLFSRHYNTCH